MNKKYIKAFYVDKPQRDNFNFDNLISNDSDNSGFSIFNK